MSSALPNPKPEKVKSRWTRNSELEFGHGIDQQNGDSNSKTIDSPSTSTSHSPLSQNTSANILKQETEPIPHYEHLEENFYLFERKKSKSKKEMRRMVCNCILTKEERQRGLLGCLDDCLNRMLMIECGSRCLLGDRCANKRFQKRQFAKVEPFKTLKKGWGLRALQQLQPGQFIVEYVGEVLDPREFKQRVKRYSKENHEHFYFMALKSDEIIDATVKGNITRFVNHSCDPNAETQKWTVNGELRIGFFAKKFVDIGDEITFDYQFQRYGKKAQRCFCESPKCRGFIGSSEVTNIDIDGSVITPKIKSQDEKTLEEEFEDLGLEEEIAKLTASGGLRNRQQTLMLARLMVRAEDTSNRQKLLEVIRGTQELAYLRLFLDYHGLQLLWSWMVDLDDVYLKGDILETLTILPVPHRTAIKDSKVLDVVERWSRPSENAENQSIESISIAAQLPLVVEPSVSVPLVEEKTEAKQEGPSQDVKEDISEKEAPRETAEEDKTKVILKTEDIKKEAETLVQSSKEQVKANESENAPSEETIKNKESINPTQVTDIQVEIELGSEIEIKPEVNGIAESESASSENKCEIDVSKSDAIKIRTTRSASSSSSTTSLSETPVTASGTGEKVIGRRISVKSRDEPKDESNKENRSVKKIIKPLPDIPRLACKLLYLWKDLKEGFRIPRLERQKRLEDEKEADRKTIEMEERKAKGLPLINDSDLKRGIDNRNNTLANILGLRKKIKRPQEDKKPLENNLNSSFQTPKSSATVSIHDSTGPTPPKLPKAHPHRMQFEMELMRKKYEEALNNYKKQMEEYNAMFQQQAQSQLPPNQLHKSNFTHSSLTSTPLQAQNIDLSHGIIPHHSPFKHGSVFMSPAGGNGPPLPPPPPPSLVYPDNTFYQGYQVANEYSNGTPTTPSYTPLAHFNDQHSSFPSGSPHIDHVNNLTSATSYFEDEDRSDRKERCFEGNRLNSANIHQACPYINPVLIECTNSLLHNLMNDEKAVIQTDYGVEYVPVKTTRKAEASPKNKTENSISDEVSSGSATRKETLFNPVFPPPGTYYLTKEGSCYFIPPPLDSHGHQIQLNVFENVPKPHPPSLTKEVVSTALPPNWRSSKDQEGNVYYYNKLSRTVQWELPEVNMLTLMDDKGFLKSKESVVVSNADSTSTPRDETLPKITHGASIISLSTTAINSVATNKKSTPSTPLPSGNVSIQESPEEQQPILNGELRTPEVAMNEDSNECSATPNHALPGSYEPDPRKRKHQSNNNSIDSNNLGVKNCSSILEVNDSELIAANRRTRSDKTEKRIKDRFKAEMSEHIKYCLNPYRKPDCPVGRILNTEHFKYVARRLTHFVMVKELKHCRNIQDLSCSETVKHKAKDYVKKYMAKQGPVYQPDSLEEEKKLSPKEMIQESVDDQSVDIFTSDQ